MNNQTIRLLIIGCKEISTRIFYDLQQFNECQIVAAYDANSLVGQAFCNKYKIEQITHFEDIQNYDYDAVVITTPSDSHFGLCQFFLEHNKYIFCKSPLIRNVDQYNFISNLSQSKKNLIYTFAPEPGESVLKEVSARIKCGDFGKINSISIKLQANNNSFLFKNSTLISSLSPRLTRVLNYIGNYHIGDIQVEDQESILNDNCINGSIDSSEFKNFNFELSWAKSNPTNQILIKSDEYDFKVNIDKNTITTIDKVNDSGHKPKILKFANASIGLTDELKNFLNQIGNPNQNQNYNPLINEIDSPFNNRSKLRRAS